MLLFPIAQEDLEHRHPNLSNELWSSYTSEIEGNSNNLTLTLVSGSSWTLIDTDANFAASGLVGLYGILVGFWGFRVTSRVSATELTITVEDYAVGTIAQTDITASLLGNYSIGGYARQLILAGEEIVKDFTKTKRYPEAFDWTERNKKQLKALFAYKTIELITLDLRITQEDSFDLLYQAYKAKYVNELNSLPISYQAENEDIDGDNFKITEVEIRR